MIKSMTGFGRGEVSTDQRKVIVEMKSVNHRYLDMSVKLPKKFSFFETAVRNLLKEYMERGKVDVFITYEDLGENTLCVKYNKELAGEYLERVRQMEQEFGLKDDISAVALSKYPDVLVMEEQAVDEEEVWKLIEDAVRQAAEQFCESRALEGEHLKQDLIQKLELMLKNVCFIEERSPKILTEYRQKLTDKVKELLEQNPVEESRILTEVAIFADKICVDEETVRLRGHVEHMKRDLQAGGSIGRKLDFLAQEMNREANTILSKANDLAISECGIELKTEIEKIREQIQNIE